MQVAPHHHLVGRRNQIERLLFRPVQQIIWSATRSPRRRDEMRRDATRRDGAGDTSGGGGGLSESESGSPRADGFGSSGLESGRADRQVGADDRPRPSLATSSNFIWSSANGDRIVMELSVPAAVKTAWGGSGRLEEPPGAARWLLGSARGAEGSPISAAWTHKWQLGSNVIRPARPIM